MEYSFYYYMQSNALIKDCFVMIFSFTFDFKNSSLDICKINKSREFSSFLNRSNFNRIVIKFNDDKYVKYFTCWNQLLVLGSPPIEKV